MNKKRVLTAILVTAFAIVMMPLANPDMQAHAAETLQWPVPGHTPPNSISGYYGNGHDGIDISDGSISGANIYAAQGGTVTKKETCTQNHYNSYHTCNGFGTGIAIQGTDGRSYNYGHMLAGSIPSNVYVGATVKKGQLIGRVGNTGNSSSTHLHFGIANGSQYWTNTVDPMSFTYNYSMPSSKWYEGESPKNLGNDFYANIILATNWKHISVKPSTWNAEIAENVTSGYIYNDSYKASHWHFKRNSDGSYQILNPLYGERPLEAVGTTSGTNVKLGTSYTGAAKQKWFIYRDNGVRIIRNAASEFVLNVHNSQGAPGTNLQIWKYTDSVAERMNIYKHTPTGSTTPTVTATNESENTKISWPTPTGEVKWYDMKLSKLNSSGGVEKSYDETYITSSSRDIKLPAGNYEVKIVAHSYFNAATGSTVHFTVKSSDSQAPTINAKVVTQNKDTVVIEADVTDNVKVARTWEITKATAGNNILDIVYDCFDKTQLGSRITYTLKKGMKTPTEKCILRIAAADSSENVASVEVPFTFTAGRYINMKTGDSIPLDSYSSASGDFSNGLSGWKDLSNYNGVVAYENGNIVAKKEGKATLLYRENKLGQLFAAEVVVSCGTHSWDSGKITKVATNAATGIKTFTCTKCAATRTEVIPKTNTGTGSDPDLKGTDGTPLGTGASVAAAEKAITSMKKDTDPAGSKFAQLQLKSTKQTKTSLKLVWRKVSGAKKYVIYGNACGVKNKMKKVATVTDTSKNFTKVLGKKVKKGTYYKFLVVALDKNNKVVFSSKLIHVTTPGGKVGNQKSVTVKAKVGKRTKAVSKVTVKKGKTLALKTTLNPKSKKLLVKKHVGARYESSNTKIATVSAKGVIKAKKKGSCYVYVYAQNGVFKKVKVTVK